MNMEVNIKLLETGKHTSQDVRVVQLKGDRLNDEAIQRVCSNLRNIYGLGAIPYQRDSENQSLLVLSKKSLHGSKLKEGNWVVELEDNEDFITLSYRNLSDRKWLADLLMAAMYARLEKGTRFWRMDTPKIWYEETPFKTDRDISAYRRYSASSMDIEGEGIGISVHVETAFFTNRSVQDYFSSGREERFMKLTSRQEGSKGTLLYRLGEKHLRCYFVTYCQGVTCGTTQPMTIEGERYENLFDYYRRKYPSVPVTSEDRVAKVSFSGSMSDAVSVPANMLYVRVMNDALMGELKQVDKIIPSERADLEDIFWQEVGATPFQYSTLKVQRGYWKPDTNKRFHISLPTVLCNKDNRVAAPAKATPDTHNNHFRQVKHTFDNVGCYHVPPGISRVIHFAIPEQVPEKIRERLADDLCKKISFLTGKEITAEILTYRYSKLEVFVPLKSLQSGMVVFVMNEEPEAYYEVEKELKHLPIKRIADVTLITQWENIQHGKERRWNSFIELCAYDVVVQMQCIPYLPDLTTSYDGMLVIDVGEKAKFFGVSLMINRQEGRKAIPVFISNTHHKPDSKEKERINARQLERRIVDTFNEARMKARFAALRSVLVVRDGKLCGDENQGIEAARQFLIQECVLAQDARFDLIDLHKTSQKEIRLSQAWNDGIGNVLEGTGVILDSKTFVLSTTGAGTLRIGTAHPLLVEVKSGNVQLLDVAEYLHQAAQFNFGSPQVAQRLPFPVKELDDKLKTKQFQHIPVRG